MNLIFGVKALPLFVATGSVGTAVALPRTLDYIKTVASVEEIFDSTVKSPVSITPAFSPIISESLNTEEQAQETKRVAKEAKISEIEKDYLRIKKWIESNGNCRVELVVSAVNGTTFGLSFDDLKNNSEDTIFSQNDSLGMSKFTKFANDLETKNDENFSKYLEGLKTRCASTGHIFFQWRDKVVESEIENKGTDDYMKNLQNLWVDESLLSGLKAASKKASK